MKNILGIFVTMPVGGAENAWFYTLEKLDRSRFNAVTCCIGEKGIIGEKIEERGHEVISLSRMKGKRFDIRVVHALSRLIKQRNIDIVHMHLYHASFYGRLAAIASGKNPGAVVSVQNVYSKPKLTRKLINRALNRFTDKFIAVSDPVKEDIINYDGTPSSKIIVVPNGILIERHNFPLSKEEAKKRLGLNGSDFVIGSVGRLVEAKGHENSLQTLSIMKKAGRAVRLIIAGSGPLEGKLKEKAAALGIASEVVFLGERHDIPEICRAMDMNLMSSLWEGLPLALADAMAAGLPCVVTSVGGMPEQLHYGECGVIVPPGKPDEAAGAIMSLMDDGARMTNFAEGARKRAVERYSSESMVREYENIYESVCKG